MCNNGDGSVETVETEMVISMASRDKGVNNPCETGDTPSPQSIRMTPTNQKIEVMVFR